MRSPWSPGRRCGAKPCRWPARSVITSYSIHYTKLYEELALLPDHALAGADAVGVLALGLEEAVAVAVLEPDQAGLVRLAVALTVAAVLRSVHLAVRAGTVELRHADQVARAGAEDLPVRVSYNFV